MTGPLLLACLQLCLTEFRSARGRRGNEILTKDLPPKYEIVLTVRLSEEQRVLYNATLKRAERQSSNTFSLYSQLTSVYNHPAMLVIDFRRAPAHTAHAHALAAVETSAPLTHTARSRDLLQDEEGDAERRRPSR